MYPFCVPYYANECSWTPFNPPAFRNTRTQLIQSLRFPVTNIIAVRDVRCSTYNQTNQFFTETTFNAILNPFFFSKRRWTHCLKKIPRRFCKSFSWNDKIALIQGDTATKEIERILWVRITKVHRFWGFKKFCGFGFPFRFYSRMN